MSSAKPAIWTRNFINISFVNLFIFFSFQMIFPVLPLYVKNMGASDSVIGLVMGIFTVSTLISRPITGLLLDTVDKKKVLVFGLCIFSSMVFMYGLAGSIASVIIIRLLHGAGWGLTGTSTATIASEIIPKSRFAEGMGYFSLANGVSMALAPAVGIFVGTSYGLKTVFFVAAALAFLSLIISLFLQCKHYTRPISPHLKKELYEKKAVNPAVLMYFLSFSYGSVISFLPLYANMRGIRHIGMFFTLYALTILLTRPTVGKIIDRRGFNIVLVPGFICLLVGIVSLAYAREYVDFLMIAVIYGIGFGALQTSLQTMAVRDVPHPRMGAANATLFSGFDLGMGSGVMILGVIANTYGYSRMYLFTALPIILSIAYYFLFMFKRTLIPEEAAQKI